MSNETYYVRSRGKVSGPFDVDGLKKMAKRGLIARVHEVSSDRVNWAAAGEYEDLFPDNNTAISTEITKVQARPHAQPQRDAEEYDLSPSQVMPPVFSAPVFDSHVSTVAPMSVDTGFYYSQRGASVGPVPSSVLTTLVQNGTLRANDMVWRDGDSSAVPARQVPSLAHLFSMKYAQPVSRDNAGEKSYRGMATAAMVLSICGLFCFGMITGVLAIIFAGIALSGMSRTGNDDGKGMAITGLVLGIIDVVGWVFWWMFWVGITS